MEKNKIILNKPMKSTRPDKKKMVYVRDPRTGGVKLIHFGAQGYKHNYSEKAWRSYIARASGIKDKRGKLTKDNKLSANYWSIRYLWPGRKGWRKK
jgi:hypothetical protein